MADDLVKSCTDSLNNAVKQNFDARKLLPREGDFILEGRFGNSIRLGSDLINENDSSN